MSKEASSAPAPDASALRDRFGFLTEAELYALLGIAHGTGKNRQNAGKLPPHYKVGQTLLYKASEVEAWIKRQRRDKAVA